jgi:hypothetical protein
MIVSLPMYDLPEVAAATEAWWQAIRAALRAAGLPAPVLRDQPERDLLAHWRRPDLLLSQTCGLPYRSVLHDHVELVGTPDFGLEGCQAGHYCSAIVVRAEDGRRGLHDFDGARLAYNEGISQSGWAAPLAHAAAAGIRFRTGPRTGAHRLSMRAVARGEADLAALRVLDRTAPTPGLPCITARGQDAPAIAAALAEAGERMPAGARDVLGLRGVAAIPSASYLALPIPPLPEAAHA